MLGWVMDHGDWSVVMMIVVWGAIAVLAVVALVWGGGRGPSTRSASALEILDQRFARGEISAEEYRRRRDTLRQRSERRRQDR